MGKLVGLVALVIVILVLAVAVLAAATVGGSVVAGSTGADPAVAGGSTVVGDGSTEPALPPGWAALDGAAAATCPGLSWSVLAFDRLLGLPTSEVSVHRRRGTADAVQMNRLRDFRSPLRPDAAGSGRPQRRSMAVGTAPAPYRPISAL